MTQFTGPDRVAVFRCDSTTVNVQDIRDVLWSINGIPFNMLTHPNVIIELTSFSRVGTLAFANLTMGHNATTVQCSIITNSGNFTSNLATLLVQGDSCSS